MVERLAAAVDGSSTRHFALVLGRLDTDMTAVIELRDALTRAMDSTDIEEMCT